MTTNVNPAFALAELRAEIERAVDKGRNAGLRSYQLEESLTDAARAVAIKSAATAPIW
jgi:hypothetical protein